MENVEHAKEIEKARQKFMKGEISAITYWNIRKKHLEAILENNKQTSKQ